jgi:hypothetical protein
MSQGYNDSSSDYGPDFTPDEEELVNNLLAKVAAEHAAALHSPAATDSPSLDQPPASPVADIEDYEAGPRFRSPKVRGREMLGSPRSRVVVGGAGQTSGYGGTALGKNEAMIALLEAIYLKAIYSPLPCKTELTSGIEAIS